MLRLPQYIIVQILRFYTGQYKNQMVQFFFLTRLSMVSKEFKEKIVPLITTMQSRCQIKNPHFKGKFKITQLSLSRENIEDFLSEGFNNNFESHLEKLNINIDSYTETTLSKIFDGHLPNGTYKKVFITVHADFKSNIPQINLPPQVNTVTLSLNFVKIFEGIFNNILLKMENLKNLKLLSPDGDAKDYKDNVLGSISLLTQLETLELEVTLFPYSIVQGVKKYRNLKKFSLMKGFGVIIRPNMTEVFQTIHQNNMSLEIMEIGEGFQLDYRVLVECLNTTTSLLKLDIEEVELINTNNGQISITNFPSNIKNLTIGDSDPVEFKECQNVYISYHSKISDIQFNISKNLSSFARFLLELNLPNLKQLAFLNTEFFDRREEECCKSVFQSLKYNNYIQSFYYPLPAYSATYLCQLLNVNHPSLTTLGFSDFQEPMEFHRVIDALKLNKNLTSFVMVLCRHSGRTISLPKYFKLITSLISTNHNLHSIKLNPPYLKLPFTGNCIELFEKALADNYQHLLYLNIGYHKLQPLIMRYHISPDKPEWDLKGQYDLPLSSIE
ncbi:hypothetical protein DLAC_03716 [Tieghemostelium lacteum]|uniref:F-box domain-containing protein n=1 Tax=Tieghemostelium lacteum TaxID=361077 RepID=A0A152A0I8_TIELA|nr:hypothetical protein DLAC_03716 [Tieghemostelium lacteum]|eukprot:KYQ99771.1 hypothetical protein DLAC_03716 [Tieghemostelium lacteum]